jgi:hypothetical protein
MTVAALLTAATMAFAQGNGKQQDGQGKYAELTADWWRWVFSLPVSVNPLFDDTGANAAVAQPENKVFFLVGVINVSGTAERTITVPAGQGLFFPVLNYEGDNATIPPTNYTVPQLRSLAAQFMDTVTELHVNLDGVSRPDTIARIKSPTFSYTLPPTDNIYQFFGLDITGTIKPAVSDGYWAYLPPLPKGTTHKLNFGGSYPGFTLDITYHISVE